MSKQIFVIHGGNAFETYDEYLSYLKTQEVSLEKLKFKGWKKSLGEVLGSKYDVIAPGMPNGFNARYLEWKIWFEKFVPLLDKSVIFIGHSLGGIFLTKYLSENNYPHKIKAVLLVAAPYNTETDHPLVDFNISQSLQKFIQQVDQIFLYQSKDDKDVPFSNFERYQKELPNAKVRIFTERQHFNQESFPEIIEDINSLN